LPARRIAPNRKGEAVESETRFLSPVRSSHAGVAGLRSNIALEYRGDPDMNVLRAVLLGSGLILALSAGAAQPQPGSQDPSASHAPARPLLTLQMPALPDPVTVTLNPATTALLVFDYVGPICNAQPKCKSGMLPAVIPFMARARKAGVLVAYGTREDNVAKWLPEVAPLPRDIQVVSTAQDRFFNTDLDKTLKSKGIQTVILVGWKVSGSVTYTSVGATARNYTVVVPVDTTAAATDYETAIGFYQILNQLGGNMANQPLKPRAATLSRTDMITFR
jgi:nicotinamidase-related amidase